jgi:benzodiazapine receptor
MSNVIRLIICIVIPQAVGALSGIATAQGTQQWYPGLVKPALTPPSSIFTPVWIVLYFLMGLALYVVWKQGLETPGVKKALFLFGVQLLLNGLWSILFFGLQSPLLGLFDIVILWFAILFTSLSFFRVSPIAGGLLIPYLLWVGFATYLNASLWYLNC